MCRLRKCIRMYGGGAEKMSNHQHLNDEMRWRIVEKLAIHPSQVQIWEDFSETSNAVSNL